MWKFTFSFKMFTTTSFQAEADTELSPLPFLKSSRLPNLISVASILKMCSKLCYTATLENYGTRRGNQQNIHWERMTLFPRPPGNLSCLTASLLCNSLNSPLHDVFFSPSDLSMHVQTWVLKICLELCFSVQQPHHFSAPLPSKNSFQLSDHFISFD